MAHEHQERLTPHQRKKIGEVMREFNEGRLFSSSGGKVESEKQALAIAYSAAGVPMKHD